MDQLVKVPAMAEASSYALKVQLPFGVENKLLKVWVVIAGEPIRLAWAVASALNVPVKGADPDDRAGFEPSELMRVLV